MDNVQFTKHGNIGILTVSRIKALNALNYETLIEIDSIIEGIKNDKDTCCLIITGEGEKAFVAGADISELKDMDVSAAREFSILGSRLFRKIELLDIPVIGAINGYALGGGCELALCCDIRIAAENAVFALPEVGLGIIPGFGGTQRVQRIAGLSKAKEMIFTGMRLNAEEALGAKLVNKVVPQQALMQEAILLAEKIICNSSFAVRNCKAAINRGMQCDIDTALSYESEVFALCFTSPDQKEAMTAFLEKKAGNSSKKI